MNSLSESGGAYKRVLGLVAPTNESSKFVGDQYEIKESTEILRDPSSPNNQFPPGRIRANVINLLSYFIYFIQENVSS